MIIENFFNRKSLEEYANIKKQVAKAANQDGEQYCKMKEPIFQKINAFIKGTYDK